MREKGILPKRNTSSVGLAGSKRDLMDNNCLVATLDSEEEAVVANSTAEDAMPLFAFKSFYVSLKGIGCHLGHHARYALLNGFRKAAEIFFGFFGKLTGPSHA